MQKKNVKTPKPVYKSFFYLLSKKTTVGELCQELDFLAADSMELWTEANILEVTLEHGTITFEEFQDSLSREDLETLKKMSVQQIYICDYQTSDSAMVQKIMKKLLAAFGGKIGQDTEDFGPFFKPEQL